mgnify:FL=1
MTLHYSIDFEDGFITHHGEIIYPIECYQNTEPYIKSMKAYCNSALQKSLKKWGFSPDDMISVDYYFYRGAEETIFFSWEKETETEAETSTIK